jgi:hypothetical protein
MLNLVNRADGTAPPSCKFRICCTVWRAAWGRALSRCAQTPRDNIPRRLFSNHWLKLLLKHITLPSTNFILFSGFIWITFECATLCRIFPHKLTFPSVVSIFVQLMSAFSMSVTVNSHKIFVIQNIADSHRRVVSTLWLEFQSFVLCLTLWALHTWRKALWRWCTIRTADVICNYKLVRSLLQPQQPTLHISRQWLSFPL